MRKSPLNMPGGSRSQNNHEWKSYVDTRRTNCGFVAYKRGCYSYNGVELNRGDNDFIPLNSSTPDQRRHSGNRYGSGIGRNHRNSGSWLFNDYRGNHFANTKPHFNNSYSPYKHTGMQFHGQNKSMQKDGHRQIDISRYIDINSILEDPWAELMQKLDDSTTSNKVDVLNGSSTIPYSKEISKSVSLVDTYFQNNQHNVESQSQSVNIDLEISDNASEVKNISDNQFGDTKLDSTLDNESLCNNSNDNNHVASKDIKQNI
ncbi:GATA zinc finger domain-containing protein 8-like isoform X2 [Vespula maculifrons]|uniref:GATA zinc finger domain-containing protein 8-like isoform X2 n=1 Tax=Vespula maculifrons TaxID=7453 RepID=A0ABD2CY85_VESMC